MVSETIADLTRESLAVVGFAGLLFYLDWSWRSSSRAAPLVVYPLVRLGQRVRRTTRRGQEELEHVTHLATEGFTGHRIVKAFGAEGREAERFARATEQLYRTNMKITGAVAALPPLMEFIGGIAAVGALWYGATSIQEGVLTSGEFTAFLAAAFMMYGPIKKLSRVNASIQQAIAAAERIFAMLDTHTEVREKPGARRSRACGASSSSATSASRTTTGPASSRLRTRRFAVEAGQVVAHRRAERRGQDDARQSDSAVLRRHRGRHPGRRRRHPRRDARVAPRADRARHAGDGALRRHDRGQHRVRRARRVARGDRGRGARRARPRVHRAPARAARARGSASAASGCRAASGSGWPSRARF